MDMLSRTHLPQPDAGVALADARQEILTASAAADTAFETAFSLLSAMRRAAVKADKTPVDAAAVTAVCDALGAAGLPPETAPAALRAAAGTAPSAVDHSGQPIAARAAKWFGRLVAVMQKRDETAQRVEHIVASLDLAASEPDAVRGHLLCIIHAQIDGLAESLETTARSAQESLAGVRDLAEPAFTLADAARLMQTGQVAAIEAELAAGWPLAVEAAPALALADAALSFHAEMDAIAVAGGRFARTANTLDMRQPNLIETRDTPPSVAQIAALYTMDVERDLHRAALSKIG